MTSRCDVSITDATFSYGRRSQPVFANLSATFKSGVVTAVTGPSGAGKSSLLFALGLLSPLRTGVVRYDRKDVSSLPDRERSTLRAEVVGLIFQDAQLDTSRTISNNLLEQDAYRSGNSSFGQLREVLRRLDVDLPLRRRCNALSGGQMQRVAVARVLLKRPAIILADEPTGNLDSNSAGVVIDALLAEAERGACVIVATHSERVAGLATSVLELG